MTFSEIDYISSIAAAREPGKLSAVGRAYTKFHLENPLALRLLSLHDVDRKGDKRVGSRNLKGVLKTGETLVLGAIRSGNASNLELERK
jgi:hypothetical protein